ncbi:MAG: stage III sporulation protein AF [Eubacteriaceae bacterium]|nr:stage III sporulation protein AF [Eubacteriaceae bacterium]
MNSIIIWVRGLFMLILSVTFLEILLPDSSMAKYVKFIFSVIILAGILNILK